MRLVDCFKKRLLRRGKPDILKSQRALEIAGSTLRRSEKLFASEFYDEVIVAAYTTMFHAARALLLRDGIFERSHLCVVEYLKRNYLKAGMLNQSHIHWFDTYRIERHETLYGLERSETPKLEAGQAIKKAKEFIGVVEKILTK
ncbi:MAG: HEPN domain-containing protein [Candidatus Hydrothermarchaeales archaeon]